MADIPEDITESADRCYRTCLQLNADGIKKTIAAALHVERERCLSKVARPDPSDWNIPAFDEQELLEWICERIRSGAA